MWNERFHLLQFSVSVRDWITNKIVSVLFYFFVFVSVLYFLRFFILFDTTEKSCYSFHLCQFVSKLKKNKIKLNTAVKFQPICINIQILI